MKNQTTTTDDWTMYIFLLKSPVSTRDIFNGWLNFCVCRPDPGYFNNRAVGDLFVAKPTSTAAAAGEPNDAFNTILKFVMAQLGRVNIKEIVIATLRGYLKVIKIFCKVAELPIA